MTIARNCDGSNRIEKMNKRTRVSTDKINSGSDEFASLYYPDFQGFRVTTYYQLNVMTYVSVPLNLTSMQ